MTQEQRKTRLLQIAEISILYRGQVIEKISFLEKFIDLYISRYLTNNSLHKSQEMQLYILGDNRISLENKKTIFQKIAQGNDEKWFNSYETMRKPIGKEKITLGTDLTYIVEERNKFAHCLAATDDEAVNRTKEFGLVRFKDTAQTFWYDGNKLHELLDLIVHVGNFIKEKNSLSEKLLV